MALTPRTASSMFREEPQSAWALSTMASRKSRSSRCQARQYSAAEHPVESSRQNGAPRGGAPSMVRIFTPSFAASRDGRARRTPEFERWYRPVERHMNDLPFGPTFGVWDRAQCPLWGARSPISRSRGPCSRDQPRTTNPGARIDDPSVPRYCTMRLAAKSRTRQKARAATGIGPSLPPWFTSRPPPHLTTLA